MNRKQQMYQKRLTEYLMERGIEENEAHTAANMAVKTLKSQGAGFQMGHARRMGDWMLAQKAGIDAGSIIQQQDGNVLNKESGKIYEKQH